MLLRRYTTRIAVIGAAFFLFGVVAASAAEFRFAVVNVQKAVAKSKAGKSARSMLEREKKRLEEIIVERRTKLDTKAKEIGDLQLEIRQKGAIWRPEERERKSAELRDRRRDISRGQDELKRMFQESRRDFQARQRKIMGNLLKQLRDVVKAIAREGKYDMIVDKTVVLYVSKTVDITEQVIKLYDKKKK